MENLLKPYPESALTRSIDPSDPRVSGAGAGITKTIKNAFLAVTFWSLRLVGWRCLSERNFSPYVS
jgi:hypothetical protein